MIQLDPDSTQYHVIADSGLIAITRLMDGGKVILQGKDAGSFKDAYNRLSNINSDDTMFQAFDGLASMYFRDTPSACA